MHKRMLSAAAVALGMLVFTATAGAATTLGITAPPTGSSAGSCFGSGGVVGQNTDDPTTPYLIPVGGGSITQWQTYTAGDTAGDSLTFAVLRPAGSGSYTVVGADTETLPNPLPSNNVASFTLSTPITVAAGDTLALYGQSSDTCYYDGGSTPSADSLFAVSGTTPPTPGETLSISGPGAISPGGFTMNLAVSLSTTDDVAVSTSSTPTAVGASNAAVLTSVVTNNGPSANPITFVDQVPSGLQIQSAVEANGTCSVSSQTVTCTVSGLAPGHSVPVDVIVTAATAGSYTNNVSVSLPAGTTDTNPANNTASATITVSALPRACIVVGLHKVASGSARTVLKELGCRVRIVNQHSGLHKGLVIGTRDKTGTYALGHQVTLVVSSGPKRKRK